MMLSSFSVQVDESTDMVSIFQLCILVRVFRYLKVKAERLNILPLEGKIHGENIYTAFKQFMEETNLLLL